MGVTASAASWLCSCPDPEQPVGDGFERDDRECGEREILDAGSGRIPFCSAFCIERGRGKESFGQVEGTNADGRRSWGGE